MKEPTNPATTRLDANTSRFISNPAGFYDRYILLLAYYETNEQAYEATERQYAEIVGRRRFKCYESFKSSYSQWCKRRSGTPRIRR